MGWGGGEAGRRRNTWGVLNQNMYCLRIQKKYMAKVITTVMAAKKLKIMLDSTTTQLKRRSHKEVDWFR